jgi:NTE family protein
VARRNTGSIALVMAGGGARGAYEAGALSVLLPLLQERGERPRILVGTSAGAINASFLAANADVPPAQLIPASLALWESLDWGEVVKPLISAASLRRVGGYAGEVLGLPGARITSLLDSAPLRRTVRQHVDFAQVAENVGAGVLDAAAVVATSALTGRSVVFHDGLESPPDDDLRGIDYVATALNEKHVLASAAIPAVFPAVRVPEPRTARGWYFDGGTRLNTPIKPALELGADRVVVVALNPLAPGRSARLAGPRRPEALEGAAEILIGILEDQLLGDVLTLASINQLLVATRRVTAAGKRRVPYILVAPSEPDSIAQRALRVIREHYSGALQAIAAPDLALLTRLTAADHDTAHAALLSFLLFAPEFAKALITLGREDAKRWISQAHDVDDLWQLSPLHNA